MSQWINYTCRTIRNEPKKRIQPFNASMQTQIYKSLINKN